MGYGQRIEAALTTLRDWRRKNQPGALGSFYRAGGDTRLATDLPLSCDDVVVDAGGYRGGWTAEILVRYGCRSLVFEPVPQFRDVIRERYAANSRVRVFGEGLAAQDCDMPLHLAEAGSSVFGRGNGEILQVRMADVSRVFRDLGLPEVGCMKINIEGSEYDVLERMHHERLHERVRCFLIQFHQTAPDSACRRETIRRRLSATHREIFCFPFVWERWDRTGR